MVALEAARVLGLRSS
ncbi:hypothetical protein BN10_140029 [Phycicoccus elongatus Lp2]|uniref:Uncharacterized protein n=1 Tax=Phycicoccus elongatus Lp2 TaxID=1193181 RepID=N0DYB6_9MICO|nr:hypothetical protein BN10_140029 [Phycicoccus elongatus Lp2]